MARRVSSAFHRKYRQQKCSRFSMLLIIFSDVGASLKKISLGTCIHVEIKLQLFSLAQSVGPKASMSGFSNS